MKPNRGFTLIELLVAINILAIIAVLGWRGLDSIVRARVSLTTELEQARGLQLAFAQMQSDCDRITNSAIIGARPVVAAQAGSLTLVRSVHLENQPSRLQVVAYRVRDGVLTRRESVATRDLKELDDAWSAAVSDGEAGQVVTLHNGVSDMTIRSWVNDGNGWRTGAGPAPGAGAPAGSAPPPANPPAAGAANPGPAAAATGLEVSLQLRERTSAMMKVFLLGAA